MMSQSDTHKTAYMLGIRFFMILLMLTMPVYTAFSLSVSNVNIDTTKTTAGVSFLTDGEADSQFIYEVEGRNETINVGFSSESHSQRVEGLSPGTEYQYTIWSKSTNGSDEVQTESGIFTTLGDNPNSGTGSGTGSTSSGTDGNSNDGVVTDTQPPIVTISDIPLETSESEITVFGSVNEPVVIGSFVRYERTGTEYEHSVAEYSAGNFSIVLPLDEGDNTILLEVNDTSGNIIYRTIEVYVDTEPPQILDHNLDELSPAYTSIVTVKGRVSEPNIAIRIYVDEEKSGFAACNDGKDNDGDGRVDFLNDKGCSSPEDTFEGDSTTVSACNNKVDDDGDGKIDFLQDPGCDSQTDNSEVDYAGGDTECSDGIDNDGDGESDFLKDDGCRSLDDDSEDSDKSGDFVTTRADENGYFSKEISLSAGSFTLFEGAGIDNIANIGTSVSGLGSRNNQQEGGGLTYTTQGTHDVRIVATDRVGQFAEVQGVVEQVSCSQGGGHWAIGIGEVFPQSVLPDHIFEGIAQVTFNLNLEYFGPGLEDDARITSATVRQQERSIQDRRELSPAEILTGSRCKAYPATDFTDKAHIVCPLNKWPPNKDQDLTAAYELLEDYEFLNFPLQVELSYQYKEGEGENVGYSVGVQKECIDIKMFVQPRLAPDKYPSELINTTVNLIDEVVEAIDGVMKPLNTVKLATTGACLATNLVGIFQASSEVAQCKLEGIDKGTQEKIEQHLRGVEGDDTSGLSEQGGICGKIHCDTCSEAILNRIQSEKTRQQLCDRIFCPAIPTATEYIKQVNTNSKIAAVSACSQSTLNTLDVASPSFVATQGCGKEYNNKWSTVCPYGTDVLAESKQLLEADNTRGDTSRVADFVNAFGQCGGSDDKTDKDFFRSGDKVFLKQDDCHILGAEKSTGNLRNGADVDQGSVTEQIKRASVPEELADRGYSNCVETLPNGELVYQSVSSDNKPMVYDPAAPDDRNEYIKVADETNPIQVTTYTAWPKDNNDFELRGVENLETYGRDSQGYKYQLIDGEWVKSKEFGYVTSTSSAAGGASNYGVTDNKNSGDIQKGPAELKQQNVAAVLKDPKGSFLRSIQCVCLPAIEGYLTVIRNVLTAVKNCFQSVLVTGEFKSGTCKAILTQYLCDWVYNLITCVFAAAETVTGSTVDINDRAATGGLLGSLSKLSEGSKKMTNEMQGRYGDTSTFNALFNKRKLIQTVCLAAFGLDWQADLDLALSVQGGDLGLNSTGFVLPATRRFVSYNPLDGGRATFTYHVGYALVAGTELNYQVELICSQDNSCNSRYGFVGGRCDCSYPGNAGNRGASEVTRLLKSGNALGGDVVGDGETSNDGTGERYELVSDPIRYDKARISWTDTSSRQANDNRLSNSQKNGQSVTEIITIGEAEPTSCEFSPISFRFACDYQAYGENGDVFFVDPKVTFRSQSQTNKFLEKEEFGVSIFARVDNTGVEPEDQIGKFARVEVKRATGGAPLFIDVTRSSASASFALGESIEMRSGYYFSRGNTNAQGGARFAFREAGGVERDPRFINLGKLQNEKNLVHTETSMTRFYVKVIDDNTCRYQTEILASDDQSRLTKAQLDSRGWSSSGCSIEDVVLTVGSAAQDGIVIVRPDASKILFGVNDQIADGLVSYFDVSTLIGSDSTSVTGVCANTNMATDFLIAEVSLLHGKLKNPDGANVQGNWKPGNVATYNGVLQKQSIPFEVICTINRNIHGAVPTGEDISTYDTCNTGSYAKGSTSSCVCGNTQGSPVVDAQTLAQSQGGLFCNIDEQKTTDICLIGGITSGTCICGGPTQSNLCAAGKRCGYDGQCIEPPTSSSSTPVSSPSGSSISSSSPSGSSSSSSSPSGSSTADVLVHNDYPNVEVCEYGVYGTLKTGFAEQRPLPCICGTPTVGEELTQQALFASESGNLYCETGIGVVKPVCLKNELTNEECICLGENITTDLGGTCFVDEVCSVSGSDVDCVSG